MNTPAQAFAWQLWRRHRWFLVAELAYLLIAAMIVWSLPTILRGSQLGDADLPFITQFVGIPCSFILLQFIAMFSFVSPEAKESGYISHLLVLPVSNRILATWPMGFGCLALAGAWLLIALFVLRPGGIDAPLWWPCTALAVVLTAVQALSWTPFKQTWLRIFVAIPMFALFAILGMLLVLYEVHEAAIACILLALLPPLYLAAKRGVEWSRRGDALDWRGWQAMVERIAAWRKPADHPFASSLAAQRWFEWRGVGWTLPTMVCAFLLCFVPLAFTNASDIEFSWRLLSMWLFLPAFTAFLMGSATGKQDVWSKYESSTFVFGRPLSNEAIVRAKFLSAGSSALIATLPMLLLMPLLLLRPGFLDSMVEAARNTSPGYLFLLLVLGVIAPVVATWLALVVNMWIGLTGRPRFVDAVTITLVVVGICLGAAGFWIFLHPELHAPVLSAIPSILAALAAIKLIAAAGTITALARSRLVARNTIAWVVAAWGLAATGLLALAAWFLPGNIASSGILLCLVILALPITRLAAAPLSLAWNRHR